MSAGDIDNRLGDLELLEEMREGDPAINQYLRTAWNLSPCRTFFIPFGAGINAQGNRPYISYDLQTIVNGIETAPCLVRHEVTEWALREYCSVGYDYASDPRGHRIANRVEHDLVVMLGLDWDLYNEIIEQQIIAGERRNFAKLPVPKDLALYPYEDDEEMMELLREAMLNDRSAEEWEKLMGKYEGQEDDTDR